MHNRQGSFITKPPGRKRNAFTQLISKMPYIEIQLPKICKRYQESIICRDPDYEIYDEICQNPDLKPSELQLRLSRVVSEQLMQRRIRSKLSEDNHSDKSDSSSGDEIFQYVDDHEHESQLKLLLKFNHGSILQRLDSPEKQIEKLVKTIFHQKRGIIERSYLDSNTEKLISIQDSQIHNTNNNKSVESYFKSLIRNGRTIQQNQMLYQKQLEQQIKYDKVHAHEKQLTHNYHSLHRQNITKLLKLKQQSYENLTFEKPIVTSQYVSMDTEQLVKKPSMSRPRLLKYKHQRK